MPSFNVKDSVAFVTGTNKPNGIGRAIVEALLSNGAAKVYATARAASQLDDLVALHSGKVVAVELDVTDLTAIAGLTTLYPDVTVVVNNAGYQAFNSSIQDVDTAVTEMKVNYLAPLAIGKAFSTTFANLKAADTEERPSALVNINSIGSFVNLPFSGTYAASKAAAHSLTQAQRRDFSNSLVIGVYPGPIDTDMLNGVPVDKANASVVADAVIDALAKGLEDVLPDPMSQGIHLAWKADYKAIEKSMADSVAVPSDN